MDGMNPLNGLDFHDELAGNEQVEPLMTQKPAAVHHGHGFLSLERDPTKFELDAAGTSVDCFTHPRAQLPMHGETRANRVPNQAFDFGRYV